MEEVVGVGLTRGPLGIPASERLCRFLLPLGRPLRLSLTAGEGLGELGSDAGMLSAPSPSSEVSGAESSARLEARIDATLLTPLPPPRPLPLPLPRPRPPTRPRRAGCSRSGVSLAAAADAAARPLPVAPLTPSYLATGRRTLFPLSSSLASLVAACALSAAAPLCILMRNPRPLPSLSTCCANGSWYPTFFTS